MPLSSEMIPTQRDVLASTGLETPQSNPAIGGWTAETKGTDNLETVTPATQEGVESSKPRLSKVNTQTHCSRNWKQQGRRRRTCDARWE